VIIDKQCATSLKDVCKVAHSGGAIQPVMLKEGIKTVKVRGLEYVETKYGKPRRFRPWLGDAFSFLYDYIMKNSIFPKKFGGDIIRHVEILSQELEDVKDKRILELAAGSGSASDFLPSGNSYTGTDISAGLLRKAVKRFREADFREPRFYVATADDLPFADDSFDICVCMLSLNFFNDLKAVLAEIRRVLVRGGVFYCSVPVPERKKTTSPIRGKLYSEEELEEYCSLFDLCLETLPVENGALLYFKAIHHV